jgi:hypothetical protein
VGNLAGQASGCVFCLTYGLAARKWPWTVCAPVAVLAFFGSTALLDCFAWTLVPAAFLLLAAILVAHRLLPPRPFAAVPVAPPRWDLPARMLVATAFVLALTACARSLGAQLSGLIAPFPIYGLVLAAFTHLRQGRAAVAGLLRANVLGSLAFISFFLIAGGGLGHLPVAGVYLLAALASVGTGGAAFLATRTPLLNLPGNG